MEAFADIPCAILLVYLVAPYSETGLCAKGLVESSESLDTVQICSVSKRDICNRLIGTCADRQEPRVHETSAIRFHCTPAECGRNLTPGLYPSPS